MPETNGRHSFYLLSAMKNIFFVIVLISPVFAEAQNNPVVIELFTSQGCSSCPAADKNLAGIVEDAEKGGKLVYGLSFHVSYWNYLGWKDPYSNPDYNDRHQEYAQAMKSSNVYTPQVIVNGREEFVGSDERSIRNAIQAEQARLPRYAIKISGLQRHGDQLSVNYTSDKDPEGELLRVAVISRELENDIPRGENRGLHLRHRNVVRALVVRPFERTGKVILNIPQGEPIDAMVLFVQDQEMHIVASSSAKIPVQ
jgi:hypothetical protein